MEPKILTHITLLLERYKLKFKDLGKKLLYTFNRKTENEKELVLIELSLLNKKGVKYIEEKKTISNSNFHSDLEILEKYIIYIYNLQMQWQKF